LNSQVTSYITKSGSIVCCLFEQYHIPSLYLPNKLLVLNCTVRSSYTLKVQHMAINLAGPGESGNQMSTPIKGKACKQLSDHQLLNKKCTVSVECSQQYKWGLWYSGTWCRVTSISR